MELEDDMARLQMERMAIDIQIYPQYQPIHNIDLSKILTFPQISRKLALTLADEQQIKQTIKQENKDIFYFLQLMNRYLFLLIPKQEIHCNLKSLKTHSDLHNPVNLRRFV